MNGSPRYQELVRQVDCLREHLLPSAFDPAGNYSPETFTRAVAYRVLAHAEIESYIEDRVWKTALSALDSWSQQNKASKTLLGLLAFSGQKMEQPPPTVAPGQANQNNTWQEKLDMNYRLQSAINSFSFAIQTNHGVKEENVLRLLLPIGVKPTDLDPVLLANLNSFGTERGIAAHDSAAKHPRHQINPKHEFERVVSLLNGLLSIDVLIDRLNEEF